jgi:hypothetical protein
VFALPAPQLWRIQLGAAASDHIRGGLSSHPPTRRVGKIKVPGDDRSPWHHHRTVRRVAAHPGRGWRTSGRFRFIRAQHWVGVVRPPHFRRVAVTRHTRVGWGGRRPIGRADVVGAHGTHHGPSMAGGLGGSSSTCTDRFGPRARWACDSLNRGIPPLENLLVESSGILSLSQSASLSNGTPRG